MFLEWGNRKVLKMFYVGPHWKACLVPTPWCRGPALLWGWWVAISVHPKVTGGGESSSGI